jgi:cytochrome c-type biogenesis protein
MDFAEVFSEALAAGNIVALPLALLGGLVAGMNPCCLALYPAAAVACCSMQGQIIKRPLGNAVAFVLGIAVAVASLGVLSAYIGRVAVMGTPFKYAIAFLPILMGVYRFGWIRLPLITPQVFHPGIGGAFGTGLLLSLIIGPCGTPLLVSVLSFAIYKQSFIYGGLLLFLYGIGNGLPVMLVGTAAGGVLKRLDCSRFGNWIDPIVGALLILLGFYLLWRI